MRRGVGMGYFQLDLAFARCGRMAIPRLSGGSRAIAVSHITVRLAAAQRPRTAVGGLLY